ncbi:hypothetical protein RM780_04840 [Streptomyces sp. DSM 44917]|uniref:Uncharacterized protein n=1 Tax=Streptomyces boetiae TaxID=3075541 RepID=A0ABU2L405_9ACTN|nr:hypothetical protein [Streptomyces sp. DSM 44917]MDT0306289.1 hypothetical protein [Streptomyces sp. DSM 44917]
MTSGAPESTSVDHEALREAVRRARRLYATKGAPDQVAATTAELSAHLRAALRTCETLAVDGPGFHLAALESARHLLNRPPAEGGPLAQAVHMQLLADAASALGAALRTQGGA